MGGLFKTPKTPDPTPPAPIPDEQDELSKRARRRAERPTSGRSSTRTAGQNNTIGQEYTRGTLG